MIGHVANDLRHHKFSEDRMCTMCSRVTRKLTLFYDERINTFWDVFLFDKVYFTTVHIYYSVSQ